MLLVVPPWFVAFLRTTTSKSTLQRGILSRYNGRPVHKLLGPIYTKIGRVYLLFAVALRRVFRHSLQMTFAATVTLWAAHDCLLFAINTLKSLVFVRLAYQIQWGGSSVLG